MPLILSYFSGFSGIMHLVYSIKNTKCCGELRKVLLTMINRVSLALIYLQIPFKSFWNLQSYLP